MILHLSLDLPEDGLYIKIVRLLSSTMLGYMKVIEEDIQDIEFVIGELCSNVTRHSHSVNGRFVVSVDFFPDKFVVEVKDNGGGCQTGGLRPRGFWGRGKIRRLRFISGRNDGRPFGICTNRADRNHCPSRKNAALCHVKRSVRCGCNELYAWWRSPKNQ
jgi:hypothetical protein